MRGSEQINRKKRCKKASREYRDRNVGGRGRQEERAQRAKTHLEGLS